MGEIGKRGSETPPPSYPRTSSGLKRRKTGVRSTILGTNSPSVPDPSEEVEEKQKDSTFNTVDPNNAL